MNSLDRFLDPATGRPNPEIGLNWISDHEMGGHGMRNSREVGALQNNREAYANSFGGGFARALGESYPTAPPQHWTTPGGTVRGAAPGPALGRALFQQWIRTPETSIFECKGFGEKRAADPSIAETTQPAISLSFALPTISNDGLSALVYANRHYPTGSDGFTDEWFLFYLAKPRGSWRVVGVYNGPVSYGHWYSGLDSPPKR